MNSNQIFVTFTFTNKKGKVRTVRFPMDKQSYDAYHDSSVPTEWTDKMMLEAYREYCAEQKYRRHVIPWPVDEEGNEVDFIDESQNMEEILIEEDKKEQQKAMIEEILSKMSPKQREAYRLVVLEGMTQRAAAKKMNLDESVFSHLYKRAKKSFEKILSEKKF